MNILSNRELSEIHRQLKVLSMRIKQNSGSLHSEMDRRAYRALIKKVQVSMKQAKLKESGLVLVG